MLQLALRCMLDPDRPAACVLGCREAEAAAATGMDVHQRAADAQQKPKAKRRRKRADLSEPKKVGPAYVQVLSRLPRPKPSGRLLWLSCTPLPDQMKARHLTPHMMVLQRGRCGSDKGACRGRT